MANWIKKEDQKIGLFYNKLNLLTKANTESIKEDLLT
jgi:hypothetical protein